jgi:hypothetical protein
MTTMIVKKLKPFGEVHPPELLPMYEAGGTTFHVHRCTSDPEAMHSWMCNSPYCEVLTGPCPDHGGPDPVVKGLEPWRR